jgi:DNA-binding PadR family transcriptional regulator
MRAVSTLGFALMALLTRGPATGYQLAQRMRAPIGHFWTANHSQIYPELARLTEAGHVRVREAAGRGPRTNKTYTLSAAGRRALADWLISPPTPQPRSEVVLKAYAVSGAEPDRMAELFHAVAEQAAATRADWLRELVDMERAGADDIDHQQFGNYAALRMGTESQRVLQEWAAWLAAALHAKAGRGEAAP